jgi:hypothetical protein
MSDPISLMAGIVFFGAVYYRAEYIRFLGPIWLAIFITERGLLFTGLGFVTATVCVVVALLVIYNSFFTKSGKNLMKQLMETWLKVFLGLGQIMTKPNMQTIVLKESLFTTVSKTGNTILITINRI